MKAQRINHMSQISGNMGRERILLEKLSNSRLSDIRASGASLTAPQIEDSAFIYRPCSSPSIVGDRYSESLSHGPSLCFSVSFFVMVSIAEVSNHPAP